MFDSAVRDCLMSLLEAHGVTVRIERLHHGDGGLCTLRGKLLLFLDAAAPLKDQVDVCAGAVLHTLDIETVYVRPEIRQVLERHRQQLHNL